MSEVLKFKSVLCTKTNNYLTVFCTEINICKFMRGYKTCRESRVVSQFVFFWGQNSIGQYCIGINNYILGLSIIIGLLSLRPSCPFRQRQAHNKKAGKQVSNLICEKGMGEIENL